MKYIICILLLFPLWATAQTYKYIGMENGLSNRRISAIQKDAQGYMWFLTDEGIDRYNGKDIKHYKLNEDEDTSNASIHLGWIYTHPHTGIWVMGRQGRIFRYDPERDDFEMVYKWANSRETISHAYMDEGDNIWLCRPHSILLYNVRDGQTLQFPHTLGSNITAIAQVDPHHFFIATEKSIRYTKLDNGTLEIIPISTLDRFEAQVSQLYYHQPSKKLFIGSFERGMSIYNIHKQTMEDPKANLSDVNITCITPLDESHLLLSTEGMGVYQIDTHTHRMESYIVANYQSYNEMNGNNINDVFVDEEKRIWLANYPTGITIIDHRYENYHWIKHAIGNRQSLVNDQVHAVIEDSDGDLWFGTSNGISLYRSSTRQWHSFLSSFDRQLKDKNHIFITLCEVSPGVIWAGGYTSGIYKIDKRTASVEYFSPHQLTHTDMRPDKYIRHMMKDSKGNIWSGGYYNLKCFDLETDSVRFYPGVSFITSLAECDKEHMWIGTTTGLYLLNTHSGQYQHMEMGTAYINSLYQADDGLLYIGTNGAGVFVYNKQNHTFAHYYTDNSALVSNRIFTILPQTDGRIMMSTENGVTCFSVKQKAFRNWTRGEGLLPAYFNASSGALRADRSFVFGSTDGAIELPKNVEFPRYKFTGMIFSDFQISYQPVYPGEENSPLHTSIDQTEELKLKYEQNTFSLQVSTINYVSPRNALFSWKLEGFHEKWTEPEMTHLIRFTNIPPGRYTLRVRAVSREENNIVFEERAMRVVVSQPFWASGWAILCYVLLSIWMFSFIVRMINLRKLKKISDEKTRFFINTAHDIRTPLTLIKAPLEELYTEEPLSEVGIIRTQTALRNVDALLRLVGNLINFERTDVYSSKLYTSEYELNSYMQKIYATFSNYAAIKHIDFTYSSTFGYMNVHFDKEKMDSILKNILSNALKYTPEGGKVSVSVADAHDSWKVVISDTGIGIPLHEQSKLFKLHFRAGNAINSKVTGSGIGLMLVHRLVRLHDGKISIESTEQEGTTVKITFPKESKKWKNSPLSPSSEPERQTTELTAPAALNSTADTTVHQAHRQRILVVEDNDELRSYLVGLLAPLYQVQACDNGKEALMIVKEFWPHLILSDVMMPQMRGDELCIAIKNDIETSHIPVLLLTALGEENDVVNGLAVGADEYIIKPFSVKLLRANIANLLANRALIRKRYANMEIDAVSTPSTPQGMNNLDWKFISDVKKNIENHIEDPNFTIEMLCDMHHMSRTSFYNKLRSLIGQSPTGLVRTIRLKRAAQLLKEGKHSVAEVADITGFSDSKYFREVFKKYYKMSPSQYAKSGGSTSLYVVEDNEEDDDE